MKKELVVVATGLLFLILPQFTQTPSHNDHDVSYRQYREEFAHNLKNPLMERYRKLSFETPEEAYAKEKENEETK